jgi:Tol biopolymer transport system component/DNA-binding winged helix-turn-helix (wHTH) protein
MVKENTQIFEFGSFVLDESQRLLSRDGDPVRIPPKSFDLLSYFVRNANRVIEKHTLMREIWPDAIVEDANLTVHISNLRKIFGDTNGHSQTAKGPVEIETFPKVGYRLKGDVRCVDVSRNHPDRVIGTRLHQDQAPSHTRRIGGNFWIWCVVLMLATGLGLGVLSLQSPSYSAAMNVTARQLTHIGTVSSANPAISADGKSVAYGRREENGKFSLWLKTVDTRNETKVAGPIEGELQGVRFLPDGNALAYGVVIGEAESATFIINKMGGDAVRLPLPDAKRVSFSPDGKYLAYFGHDISEGRNFVIVANADGSEPRNVHTRQAPEFYFLESYPEWSPDGKRLACITENGHSQGIGIVDVENGAEKAVVGADLNDINSIAWLPDMSGFIASASRRNEAKFQLWELKLSGDIRPISNDTANHWYVGLSGDGKTILTSDRQTDRSLWTAPVVINASGKIRVNESQAKQISPVRVDGGEGTEQPVGLSWVEDKSLVFPSEESGNLDIWMIDSDGSNRRQLTADPNVDTFPVTSPNGKQVAFLSNRAGPLNLWLMDVDGNNQRRLTEGALERAPVFTKNGEFLFFRHWQTGRGTLWRIPTEGGSPSQVIDEVVKQPSLSPNGRWLVYNTDVQGDLVVRAMNANELGTLTSIKVRGNSPRWYSNSSGFAFVARRNGFQELAFFDLNTNTVQPISSFRKDVLSYAWSNNGNNLGLILAETKNDLVVFHTD